MAELAGEGSHRTHPDMEACEHSWALRKAGSQASTATASLWPSGTHPLFSRSLLLSMTPAQPPAQCTRIVQNPTARPALGHTGQCGMERVLRWRQRHGTGLKASSGEQCLGASTIGRRKQHGEEDLPLRLCPSMSPRSDLAHSQQVWGHQHSALIHGSGETARVSGAVSEGFYTAAPNVPCQIGMMRFIRCSDNMLRKARKKMIDLTAYLLPCLFFYPDRLTHLLLVWASRCSPITSSPCLLLFLWQPNLRWPLAKPSHRDCQCLRELSNLPSPCSGPAADQRDIFGVVAIRSEVVNVLEH